MPQVETQFGSIEYRAEDVLEFPQGLPAFEREKFFLLIERPTSKPMLFLQSLARPDLCFVTLPVRIVDADYQLSVNPEDLEVLGVTESHFFESPASAVAILSLTEFGLSANLLAPVLISWSTRRGVQSIRRDTRYSHQQPVEALCS